MVQRARRPSQRSGKAFRALQGFCGLLTSHEPIGGSARASGERHFGLEKSPDVKEIHQVAVQPVGQSAATVGGEKDCCENSFQIYRDSGSEGCWGWVQCWQTVDHQGLRQMDSVTQASMLLSLMTVLIPTLVELVKCKLIRHCSCCLQCPLCTFSCADSG